MKIQIEQQVIQTERVTHRREAQTHKRETDWKTYMQTECSQINLPAENYTKTETETYLQKYTHTQIETTRLHYRHVDRHPESQTCRQKDRKKDKRKILSGTEVKMQREIQAHRQWDKYSYRGIGFLTWLPPTLPVCPSACLPLCQQVYCLSWCLGAYQPPCLHFAFLPTKLT